MTGYKPRGVAVVEVGEAKAGPAGGENMVEFPVEEYPNRGPGVFLPLARVERSLVDGASGVRNRKIPASSVVRLSDVVRFQA